MVIISVLLGLVFLIGVIGMVLLYRQNCNLRLRIIKVQAEIDAKVEERLISHTKYCESVDSLVQAHLKREEEKWRALIQTVIAGMRETVQRETDEISKGVKKDVMVLKDSAERVSLEADKILKLNQEEIAARLEKQKSDFKALLDAAYLEQYEKMRRSPPRPKKSPRKKVDPPSRYRSLDDDFCFMPPAETPAQPEEPKEEAKPKKKTRKKS